MINKKTNTFVMCCAALALILGFSGCGGGGTPPKSIQITITNIDLSKMPDFNKKGMAGFTVSLIPADADVNIDWNVAPWATKTILRGPVQESVRPFLTNPPNTSPFEVTFHVQENAQFTGTGEPETYGEYVVVLGVSNAYNKYDTDDEDDDDDTGEPYLEGKMFISNDLSTPSVKGTREIVDGLTLSWKDNFLKNDDAAIEADKGKGYSAIEIADMFP